MAPGTNNRQTTEATAEEWAPVVNALSQFGVDPIQFANALTYVHEQKGGFTGCLLMANGTDITIPQQLLRESADISPGVASGSTRY